MDQNSFRITECTPCFSKVHEPGIWRHEGEDLRAISGRCSDICKGVSRRCTESEEGVVTIEVTRNQVASEKMSIHEVMGMNIDPVLTNQYNDSSAEAQKPQGFIWYIKG